MGRLINVGCGNNVLKDFENFDMFDDVQGVKKLDMNQLPLPFESSSVSVIYAFHVLEHLYIPIYEVMKEFHRVLEEGGVLVVKLPINLNIVTHQKSRFNIYYFNEIVENPVGSSILVRSESSFQSVKMYRVLYVKKVRNVSNVLFHHRLGSQSDVITNIHLRNVLSVRFMFHKLYDLFFNGEIEWRLQKV